MYEIDPEFLAKKVIVNYARRLDVVLGNATQFEQEIATQFEDAKVPLEVSVIVSDTQEPILLDFNYTILAVKGDEIKIKLDFDLAEYVSSGIEVEELQITFWGGQFFIGKETETHIQSGTVLTAPIIRQVAEDGKSVVVFKTWRLVILIGIAIVLIGALLMFVLINGKFMYAWSFINTMQILTHTPLFAIQMPGDLNLFLVYLMYIFRFSFWPTKFENWLGLIFSMPDDGNHHSEVFRVSGYRTT